jgi:MinD-like ATPase involved in chromosome partitioning or flagellar assembly
VVVNRVRAGSVGPRPEHRIAEALGRFAGLGELTFLPYDRSTCDGAVFAGTTLAEFAPESELRRAIRRLADGYAVEPVTSRRTARGRRVRS